MTWNWTTLPDKEPPPPLPIHPHLGVPYNWKSTRGPMNGNRVFLIFYLFLQWSRELWVKSERDWEKNKVWKIKKERKREIRDNAIKRERTTFQQSKLQITNISRISLFIEYCQQMANVLKSCVIIKISWYNID